MNRVFFLLLLVIVALVQVQAQKSVTGKSSSGFVSITKDPPKPPFLEVVPGSLTFLDDNGNRFIDANERALITFELKNSGMGKGLAMKVLTNEKSEMSGLTFSSTISLPALDPGKSMSVDIPVSADMNTRDGKALFSFAVDEANGFGTDPMVIEIPVRAFVAPDIQIVDYKISSQSGTTIQKKRPFDVQVLVQNLGQGRAENVSVSFPVANNIFCLSGNESTSLGVMEPGESRLIDYSLVANNNYLSSEIALNFTVSEKHRKYAQGRELTVAMNQQVSSEKLVVTGILAENKAIRKGSLSSAVDKNIPVNRTKHPEKVALIIGNEDYSGNLDAEVNVDFARNDARVFREYALKTLGVEEKNLTILTDATSGEMRREIDLAAKLVAAMGPDAELIFYYAGHGFPDEQSKVPYLVPVDVTATNLESAIKVSEVYKKFGNSGASKVTVFLDACFSGGGRNTGLLAARGIRVKPREEVVTGNMVVFTASSGEQSSLSYKQEQHGMFTYFLLKKLQETGGELSYGEMADYLKSNIPVESLRINGKEQEPEVLTGEGAGYSWAGWKFTGK